LLRAHDQHLDIGQIVCDAARHAAGQHDLLDDLPRQCVRDGLCEIP
jgi:hypothetical protein